jgi:hypothetical protein
MSSQQEAMYIFYKDLATTSIGGSWKFSHQASSPSFSYSPAQPLPVEIKSEQQALLRGTTTPEARVGSPLAKNNKSIGL